MSLTSIQVKNYRGFTDLTEIIFKPITILIGRNSSGKSSLLRLIPLIQQSLEKTSSAPILWDSSLVDLGSIRDVISADTGSEGLMLGFNVRSDRTDLYLTDHVFSRQITRTATDLNYRIYLKNKDGKTAFNKFDVQVYGRRLAVEWGDDGVVKSVDCDGKVLDLSGLTYQVRSARMFPEINRVLSNDELKSRRGKTDFLPIFRSTIDNLFHGKTSEDKKYAAIRGLRYKPLDDFEKDVRSLPHIVKSRITEELVCLLHALIFFKNVESILGNIEDEILPVFRNSAYIGPARARAERFNRVQDFAVHRLSSSGENTAMYLASLSDKEKNSFERLMILATDHVVSIEASGPSHVSMQVGRNKNERMENVNDIGFGFSQIIPVVAQLHAISERPMHDEIFNATQAIYAVEQPELHLHPAMQGKLADLFADVTLEENFNDYEVKIIAETHSESLIARLGMLIATETIPKDSVNIIFVEKDIASNKSTIRNMSFDEDGNIPEWPLGFFSN